MLRVAFYSHDTFGLGHLRRCRKIYAALALRLGPLEGLFVTGSPWAGLFPPPGGARVVRIPPVVKTGARAYRSRERGVPFGETLARRRRRISEALARFRPDLMIVDNVPCGLASEVLPALRSLKTAGRTAIVLALRDVLDETATIAHEWSRAGAEEALSDLYDEIWVFGDAEDTGHLLEGPLQDAEAKVVTCGRLHPRGPCDPRPPRARRRPVILVTGGGGGDARPLVRTYLEAVRAYRPPVASRIVLGPDFPRAETIPPPPPGADVALVRFLPRLEGALRRPDVVVAMAGYNTICEILATGRPAVLVPRARPRREQLLRARKLEARGRALCIDPGRMTPETLWHAIEETLRYAAPAPERGSGSETAAARAAQLLATGAR